MDSNGTFARSFDESLTRELPHLRIAPLREPVSSRLLRIPFPLEPNASGRREPNAIPKPSNGSGILLPRNEPSIGVGAGVGLIDGTNGPRLKKNDYFSTESLLEAPPRPILPAFVNLRALERFPYSSFDDDGLHSRKRRRVDLQPDSFSEHLQLPIPQAQKEQRPPPFGPFAILNGLNEPPPNAALLPPIEAGSITQLLTKPSRDGGVVEPSLLGTTNSVLDTPNGERREGRIEDILDSPIAGKLPSPGPRSAELDKARTGDAGFGKCQASLGKGEQPSEPTEESDEPLSPKTRGRSRKNLRKWTEEETISLLRGVVKCGIGNWKAILAQPELKFNKRSASNLKDRFRVCCPWAYRASDPNEAIRQLRDALANALSRAESNGLAGKIRFPEPRPTDPRSSEASDVGQSESSSSSFSSLIETARKSPKSNFRSPSTPNTTPTPSSESKSTLESLGIPEPHFTTKSRRRSRRPFTAAEDEALLKGYAVHGFQWTLIQQDKRLNLGHRRATDLRDRFRTKFPHAYRDGGSVSGRTLQAQAQSQAQAQAQAQTQTKDLKDGTNRGPAPSSKQSLRFQDRTRTPSELHPGNGRPDFLVPNTSGPLDLVLPSPVPPSGFQDNSMGGPPNVFPFPLDDNSTNTPGVDPPWANTLPPLVWDDLP